MLQDNIKKIEEYFKSVEINNGIIIVKVIFKDKWGVYPREDDKIKVVNSKNDKNEWLYYGKNNEITLNEIFDFISNTIKMNLDASMKIDLLTEKFDELKALFANESLEKLKTLAFVFKDENDIKPKKRKYVRHKKTLEIKDEKLNENLISEIEKKDNEETKTE